MSTVQDPLSTVHSPRSTVHCPLSIFHCPLFTVHGVHCQENVELRQNAEKFCFQLEIYFNEFNLYFYATCSFRHHQNFINILFKVKTLNRFQTEIYFIK